jgi:hypothetical protein
MGIGSALYRYRQRCMDSGLADRMLVGYDRVRWARWAVQYNMESQTFVSAFLEMRHERVVEGTLYGWERSEAGEDEAVGP